MAGRVAGGGGGVIPGGDARRMAHIRYVFLRPLIPEDTRALLFHPFARGKVSSDKEGLGLGLYIASEIATAHGGQLSVTSDYGGTCFSLRLPLEDR